MEDRRYPSVTGSLEQSAQEIGQAIRGSPRVQVGNPQTVQPIQQPVQQAPQPVPIRPQTEEDPFMKKFRRIMLISLSALIAGVAVIMIAVSVWGKIFS